MNVVVSGNVVAAFIVDDVAFVAVHNLLLLLLLLLIMLLLFLLFLQLLCRLYTDLVYLTKIVSEF